MGSRQRRLMLLKGRNRHTFCLSDVREHTQMIQPPRHSRRPTPEERKFLDALVFLRGLYAERGPQDSRSATSVESTIAAAEHSMRMLHARDAQLRRRFLNG
jgi:hypothetical protein